MTENEASATLWDELQSPVNVVLLIFIVYLLYKIVKSHMESGDDIPYPPSPPPLAKLRKDMTVAELNQYDGTNEEGRVLLAVNGIIFDVTRGKRFYGPGKLIVYFYYTYILNINNFHSCTLYFALYYSSSNIFLIILYVNIFNTSFT